MNTNFENLPSLNSYLTSSLENIGQAVDKTTEINHLIQVMRQNEGLLTPKTTHPRDLVQYLKLADRIRDLTKVVGSESNPTLDNVIRAATARFTRLDAKHAEFAITLIQQLKSVSSEIYLQTFADWIAENKIALNKLNLTQAEMLDLAPHLTYLNISLGPLEGKPNGKIGYANDKDKDYENEFLGNLLEKTEHVTTLILKSCYFLDYRCLSRLKNTQDLQKVSTDEGLFLNIIGIRKFFLPIYLEDRERALQMIRNCTSRKNISETDLLQDYFSGHDSVIGSKILSLIGEIKPENLGPMLKRKDIPFVHEDLLKDDPLQQLYIYQLCSELPTEKIPRLKELLTPLIKSPMDEPLLNFYESLTSLEGEVAFGKIELASGLNLNREQLLRYFPFIRNAKSDADVEHILKNFINLEKTGLQEQFMKEIPAFHHIMKIDGLFTENHQDNATTIKIVHYLSYVSSDVLTVRNNLLNLERTGLLGAFRAKYPLRHNYFPPAFLRHSDLFTENKENNESMLSLINRAEPYWKASLYVSDEDVVAILENLININKAGWLDGFIVRNPPSEEIATILSEKNFFTDKPEDIVTILKALPYLIPGASKAERVQILMNVRNLEKTGQLEVFLEKFPLRKIVPSILATADLFTANGEENALAIGQLSDLEVEFANLNKVVPIREMPWTRNADTLAQTVVGKTFIRLHFSDFVKEATLQETILRAFPPGKPENVALYPMKVRCTEGKLVLHVVPTLPLMNAKLLLNHIVMQGFIKRLRVKYYGTPAADLSGPGRQLVSEVIQGYVINQENLFIRLAGGGMYPYDPTHKKDPPAVRESYWKLGQFLGIALQLMYPIGKVLSEKTLNCMLSFKAKDLNDWNFDVQAFLAKMKVADLIHFMKESTNDDADSVKPYEKVFLSENPDEILQSAAMINQVLEDNQMDGLIAGGAGNVEKIRERLRAMWVEDHVYSVSAIHAMAQGLRKRLPKAIGDQTLSDWNDVRRLGAAWLSKHLQGELTAQFVKEHIHVRIIGEETPEKRQTADNVRKWTDEWIDANGDDPEKLANFVQAFSGARAMTKDIYLDINPNYNVIEAHTCFNRADIPPGSKEGFVKHVWDDYSTGNLEFNKK